MFVCFEICFFFIRQMSGVSRSADGTGIPLQMQIRPYGATEAKMVPLFLTELLKLNMWQLKTGDT